MCEKQKGQDELNKARKTFQGELDSESFLAGFSAAQQKIQIYEEYLESGYFLFLN